MIYYLQIILKKQILKIVNTRKNKICFVGNYVSSGVKIACYAAAIGGEMPDNAKPIDDILANKSNVYSLLIRKTDVGVYHPTKISSSNTENCENDTAPGIQSSSVNSKTE